MLFLGLLLAGYIGEKIRARLLDTKDGNDERFI